MSSDTTAEAHAGLVPVVVTTQHRGVFFGYAAPEDPGTGRSISLKDGRMCVYWSPATHGVPGLAKKGPDKDCRISAAADVKLHDVTATFFATPAAVEAWEAEPWKG